VGSLLRPRELRQAFHDFRAGKIDADEFASIQDRAIKAAVELQERAGLESITDGEFRRGSYWSHFVDAVEGLTVKESLFQFRGEDGSTTDFTAPHVAGRLRRARGIGTGAFKFLRDSTRRTPKVTMPSPSTMHFWRGPAAIEGGTYDGVEDLLSELAAIYRAEIAELAALGARWIQFDEVPIAMVCDPDVRERVRARGEDPDGLVSLYIDAINQSVAGAPAEVAFAMHLCRGNYKGRWLSAGGYEPVAERLFNDARIDAFLLEYDTPRAGDFAPLRHLPKGKIAVLGLVSTKTPVLEDRGALKRRIDEASRMAALDQLAMCPQCGFASTVAGNPLNEDDEERKLRLVCEVAREVWG
jgi:5-methyltetrahydropteroyltriglutamate--homocysteine methyltransferase